MDRVDTVVIGAGVVGLAIARRLAMGSSRHPAREVVVLEAAGSFGTGTSARNSEVIHAGIYYAAGSLKARACVTGRQALYAYCRDHGVEHRRTGKLIVATTPDQLDRLTAIRAHAAANGVTDLERLDAAGACALEPGLACTGALLSPSTGIIDSHGLMLALLGDAEAHGAAVAYHAPLLGGAVTSDGFVLEVGGETPSALACRTLINAAGLSAWDVAAALRGFPGTAIPPRHFAKGNYFALSGCRAPFSRLIYPVPENGGLGVHLTLDLAGQARFGPDVEWLDEADPAAIDYRVNPARGERFYDAIRRYWPALPDGALVPAYAGVRPKRVAPGEPEADFLIAGPADHGVPGLVHLFAIESPGLTSCLALADEVAAHLDNAPRLQKAG